MKIEMAAIEQGKPGEVLCKIEVSKPFEGKAKITLNGLPAKAETKELEFTKDEKELHFPITTAADTPAGKHKQLFCYLEIPEAGTMIPHNVGHGGVIRIDPPPPAPKNPEPNAGRAKYASTEPGPASKTTITPGKAAARSSASG